MMDVAAEEADEESGLDAEDGAVGAAVTEFGVGGELVEALFPGAEDGFFCVGLHGAAVFVGDEVPGFDHAGVDAGDDGGVGEDGAEGFHEIEGEGGSAVARAVVEAPPRVESFAPEGDEAFFDEERVGEGEECVDRVFGRAAVAGGEIEIEFGGFEHG